MYANFSKATATLKGIIPQKPIFPIQSNQSLGMQSQV